MTSNLGSQWIQRAAARTTAPRWSGACRTRCASHFRPEFLNRIDEVVVFHAARRAGHRRIVDLQARRLRGACCATATWRSS